MKYLIWGALQQAAAILEKQVPATKLAGKNRRVDGMTMAEVIATYPTIPAEATFVSDHGGNVTLEWSELEPMNEADILKFKKQRFPSIAWSQVYHALTNAGYKRVSVCTSIFKQFDNICLYSIFLLGDAEFFVKYYALRFKKK